MLKMREAFEKAQMIAKDGEAIAAEYSMNTFNQRPCKLYVAPYGHFEGYTWEDVLQGLVGKIVGLPFPPDEGG